MPQKFGMVFFGVLFEAVGILEGFGFSSQLIISVT